MSHARLAPSNHRWPNCPGSVREEAAYPDISGAVAIDGTGSHLLLEMCLLNNVRAEAYDQQIIGANHEDNPNGWLVAPDRIERVQMCLDYISTRVKQLRDQYPGSSVKVEAESHSDPGGAFGRDDWHGTCDVTITVVNQHNRCLSMEVVDYKDGQGWVDARDNTQLISYLFGKLRPYLASGPDLCRPFRPDQVTGPLKMTIVQPKTNPVVRSDEISSYQLVEKIEQLSVSARATDRKDAPLIPDEKGGKGYCRWCKHKPNCTAHGERDLEKVKIMSEGKVIAKGQMTLFETAAQALGNIAEMSTEQLTQLADAEPGIMSIFDRAKEEIQKRVDSGEQVDGWAMIPGKGSNIWNDSEENIVKALKSRRLKMDDIYLKKLASPAQILKSSKLNKEQKERLEKEFVTYKAGSLKLTRVTHEKKKESVEQMFADVPSFIDAPVVIEEEPVSFF